MGHLEKEKKKNREMKYLLYFIPDHVDSLK